MSAQERIQRKLDNLKKSWELLEEKINRVNQQLQLEDRADGKMRMQVLIDDARREQEQLEADMGKLEAQLGGTADTSKTNSTQATDTPEIFISYGWGGESERIVNQLDEAFQQRDVTIIRDKRNLGYKGGIKDFMQQIGRGKYVIVVISHKYLTSENCMYELLEIADHGDLHERVFPIVLEDANIYKAINRINYVKHWEAQIKELDAAMKEVDSANLQGIRDDIDLYTKIRATIAGLADFIKDMNTLTPEMHENDNFQTLFEAVEQQIQADRTAG